MDEPIFTPKFLNVEYIFNKIYLFFTNAPEAIANFLDWLDSGKIAAYVHTGVSVLSIFLITGIIYTAVRVYEIRKSENEKYHFAEVDESAGGEKRERWEMVLQHIESTNAAQWRLAIIEADSILDEVVQKMGYEGDTLGERLKTIDVSDLNSIQDAWEAHRVRNQIAHEGATFMIDHREARRIIGLYEKVFKEFGYI